MQFLLPCNPLKHTRPDETYEDQVSAFRGQGFATCVVSIDHLAAGTARITPLPERGSRVAYRGWMLTADDYGALVALIEAAGNQPLTSKEQYLLTHHLPNWYPLLSDSTPETIVFPADANLETELHSLGWKKFFVKDYVKSLKTSLGSIVDDPSRVAAFVEEMRRIRGTVEGGFCVRRVEAFVPESEIRYFVIKGKVFAPTETLAIPPLAHAVAERISSPFFSIDIIRRADGALRVVEIGDGQVSDIVGWTPERLARIWKQMCSVA